MDVGSTFVCIHSLEVAHMSDDVVFIYYSVATKHISGISSDLKSLSSVVSLQNRDHLW